MASIVEAFVNHIIAVTDYEDVDRIYLTNRIMALVGEEGVGEEATVDTLIELKDALIAIAVQNGFVSDLLEEQDCLGAALMDFVTPPPSVVNRCFWQTYKISPKQAIADFYDLSKANDYVKVKAIEKNMYFPVRTAYGDLEITINLSKPENDPKAIAAAKLVKSSTYPLCYLCMENEGYQGRLTHPARANHRVIRYEIADEEWGFQYSPYAYFNEHCIFFYGQHEPMQICPKTFERLLGIVEQFPGYFAGSNADLPIVGGSILTHEHYQGGRHTFAMEKAPLEQTFQFVGFESIEAGIVKWPMSVLRLRGEKKAELVALATKVLQAWQNYSDPSVQVLAQSNGQLHHTITPIARRKGELFELDLVLRDNQTSEEYPDGIYHPHPDVQHIKKENIGLIEVMGLAILPPRLKEELREVERYLLGDTHQMASYHQKWADSMKESQVENLTPETISDILQEAIGQVFLRVLEDAGVYKRTEQGQAAFLRFVESIGVQ